MTQTHTDINELVFTAAGVTSLYSGDSSPCLTELVFTAAEVTSLYSGDSSPCLIPENVDDSHLDDFEDKNKYIIESCTDPC